MASDLVPLDLTCWYLNMRRVIELTGDPDLFGHLEGAGRLDEQMRRIAQQRWVKEALRNWLAATNPPSLGKLILEGGVREGAYFTHYANYFFRGLPVSFPASETSHNESFLAC